MIKKTKLDVSCINIDVNSWPDTDDGVQMTKSAAVYVLLFALFFAYFYLNPTYMYKWREW